MHRDQVADEGTRGGAVSLRFSSVGTLGTLALLVLILTSSVAPATVYPNTNVSSTTARVNGLADSWPTFHKDVSRSGFAEGSAPHSPRILWNFTVNGGILSSPIVGNGMVYFGSRDGYVYGLNQSTGKEVWSHPICHPIGCGGVGSSSPVLYGDSIYAFNQFGGNLFRINALTGVAIWNISVGTGGYGSLLAVGGVIYTPANGVIAVDATGGSVLWTYPVSEPEELAYYRGILFAGSGCGCDGRIVALNATTGNLTWSYQTGDIAAIGLTIVNGILYGGGGRQSPGNFSALNATSGSVFWSLSPGGHGPPAAAYGMLFMPATCDIVARNWTTSQLLWLTNFDCPVRSDSVPAVADRLVFLGGGESYNPFGPAPFYALNATSGQIVWVLALNYCVDSSPAIANGTIYVGDGCAGSNKGTLYAIVQRNQPPFSPQGSLIPFTLVVSFVGALTIFIFWLRLRRKRVLSVNRSSSPSSPSSSHRKTSYLSCR